MEMTQCPGGGEATAPVPQRCSAKGKAGSCLHALLGSRDVSQPLAHEGKILAVLHHPPQKPLKNTLCVHCCSPPAPWIQPVLLTRDSRLWVARAPSFLTPVDEFLSTLCAMSSPSSLPALPLTIYGCTAQSRSHLCPCSGSCTGQSAPACCCLHTELCATASCKMAAPSPRNLGDSQRRLSQNVQISRWGGYSPRNIKMFH